MHRPRPHLHPATRPLAPVPAHVEALIERLDRATADCPDTYGSPQSWWMAVLARRRATHAMQPDRAGEIALRLRQRNQFERDHGSREHVLDDVALERRIRTVQRAHDDLWEAGFQIRCVDNLRQQHTRALLARWRDEQALARSTVLARWRALHWWVSRCLGKPTLVPPLEAWWPEPPESAEPQAARSPGEADGTRPVARRTPAADVDAAALAAALWAIDERAGWMLRLRQTMGLTVLEAARIDPRVSTAIEGVLVTMVGRSRTGRTIALDAAGRALAAELHAWGLAREPGRLGWFEHDDRQIANRFNYLQRRAADAAAAAAQQEAAQ